MVLTIQELLVYVTKDSNKWLAKKEWIQLGFSDGCQVVDCRSSKYALIKYKKCRLSPCVLSVISAVLEEVLGKGPEDTVTNKREQNHGQQSQSIKTTINMFIS